MTNAAEPQDRGYKFCAVCEANVSPGSLCPREDCGLDRDDRGRITSGASWKICPECGCGPGEEHRPRCTRGPFVPHKPRRVA